MATMKTDGIQVKRPAPGLIEFSIVFQSVVDKICDFGLIPHPLVSIHALKDRKLLRWRSEHAWSCERERVDRDRWMNADGHGAIECLSRFARRQALYTGSKPMMPGIASPVAHLELHPFGYFAWHRGAAERAVMVVVVESTGHELLDALAAFPERRATIGDGIPA